MTTRADLVIVGAGLAGAAAAWAAARRGLDVVLLEAHQPGHRRGSSHGSARIFRRAYPDPLYVRLTGLAGERWRELEDQAGGQRQSGRKQSQALLTRTGAVDFGVARDPAGLHAVLTGCGVAAELLPPEAAAERWPSFDFTGAGPVLFHGDAGVIDPDAAMAAMLRLAVASGADVRFGTPVTRLEAAQPGDGAVARTDSGDFAAPVIAVAAGAWTGPLLDGLMALPPLTVTQQSVFHFGPAAPAAGSKGPFPTFISWDGTDYFYGLPGGRDGEVPGAVKVGEHGAFRVTTADGRDFTVDPAARARVSDFVRRRLPGLAAAPVNEATCLYTWTANEDFVLDRRGPFVVASACSGHGAKFAPLLGEAIADLAAGGPALDPRFTLAAHARSGQRGSA
jgi:monomeric sarcosine oxidase